MCLEILSGGGYTYKKAHTRGMLRYATCICQRSGDLILIYSFFFFLPYKAMDLVSWTISQLTELKVQFLLERCKVFFKVSNHVFPAER